MADEIFNLRDYQLIIKRCDNFDGCRTDDDRWGRLLGAYGWRNREDARAQLSRRNIDVDILFRPRLRPKTNQAFIADHIMQLWEDKLDSDRFMTTFTSEADGFSPVLMKELIDVLKDSARRIGLADIIADRIRSEVNVANVANIKESLVADIMSSTINNFVKDFGYSYFDEATLSKVKNIVELNSLPVYRYIGREQQATYSRDELAHMFEVAFEFGSALTESFDNRYNEWLEYMTVGFVAHLKQSDLPADVNRALGALLDKITF